MLFYVLFIGFLFIFCLGMTLGMALDKLIKTITYRTRKKKVRYRLWYKRNFFYNYECARRGL